MFLPWSIHIFWATFCPSTTTATIKTITQTAKMSHCQLTLHNGVGALYLQGNIHHAPNHCTMAPFIPMGPSQGAQGWAHSFRMLILCFLGHQSKTLEKERENCASALWWPLFRFVTHKNINHVIHMHLFEPFNCFWQHTGGERDYTPNKNQHRGHCAAGFSCRS